MESQGQAAGDQSTEYRPKRADGVQEGHTQTEHGEECYVLHNPSADGYVEIDAQNYYLWELMDGEHTLADLAMAYDARYGAFPLDRLSELMRRLEANSLLEGSLPLPTQAQASGFAFRIRRLADTAFQREFDLQHADEFYGAFYRRVGRAFFTRAALLVFSAVAVIGFACFIYLEPTETYNLLHVNDSYGLGILVLVLANTFVLFWHESGHALTCKHFGRRVRKAGMMFYFGMPAFFVDVSDMWMAPRGPRILVSLAGPIVNVILGGVLAITVALLPPATVTQLLFQAAFVAYLGALLNLIPLLELDGYYVLVDWLEMPELRRKSFAFVRNDLIRKIRTRAGFTREEVAYSVFGVTAIAFTALMVFVALYVWESEIKVMLQDLRTGRDLLGLLLLGGLTLAAGASLAVGLLARLIVFVDASRGRDVRLQEEKGVVEGAEQGERPISDFQVPNPRR
jgi:putative peptide zinc metalloprotease protein